MGEVLRGPPVRQPACCVELAALVVEAVTDLVADDRANRTIPRGGARLRVVERWIEDCGREVQRILNRQVDRVDRLRIEPPLAAIRGLPKLLEAVLVVEQLSALGVADRVSTD